MNGNDPQTELDQRFQRERAGLRTKLVRREFVRFYTAIGGDWQNVQRMAELVAKLALAEIDDFAEIGDFPAPPVAIDPALDPAIDLDAQS